MEATFAAGNNPPIRRAVIGLGGVGKTQIAIEFAYRNLSNYDFIWWIRAENAAVMSADLKALGAAVGVQLSPDATIKELIQDVYRAFGKSRWLLIFDSAEEPSTVSDLLPKATGYHIIVTTRDRHWGEILDEINIPVFSRADAKEYIQKSIPAQADEAYDSLASIVGDLPLALTQAIAYMREVVIGIDDYIYLFTTKRRELWKEQRNPVDYPETVETTWSLTMKRVRELSPVADAILNLCSFCAPESIPRRFITESVPHWPTAVSLEDKSTTILLNRGIGVLMRYSLVEANTKTLSLHRLVQSVTRDRLTKIEAAEWCEVLLRTLHSSLVSTDLNPSDWPTYFALLPHALSLLEHAYIYDIGAAGVGLLEIKIGSFLTEHAVVDLAKLLLERGVKNAEVAFGTFDPLIAGPLTMLGRLEQQLNHLERAQELMERALRIDLQHYGPTPPTLGGRYNNLGSVAWQRGNLEDARRYFHLAVPIVRNEIRGRDFAAVLGNFGNVLLDLGQPEEALKHFNEAWSAICDDNESSDLAKSRILNGLGAAHLALERVEESINEYQASLQLIESTYGPLHPIYALSLSNLGSALERAEKPEQGRDLIKRAIEIYESNYGPEYHGIAISCNNLSYALLKLDDSVGAEANLRRALRIDEAAFGSDNHRVVGRCRALGNLTLDLKRPREALGFYVRCLHLDESLHGVDSVESIEDRLAIHAAHFELREFNESLKAIKAACRIASKHFGADHPNALSLLTRLAISYAEAGDSDNARDTFLSAIPRCKLVFGESSPMTQALLAAWKRFSSFKAST